MQPANRAEVASSAPQMPNPGVWVTTGDPLDERIKFGDHSSIAERVAVGLQVARLIHAEHDGGKTFGGILSSDVYVGDNFRVSVGHRPRAEHATTMEDVRCFGFLLYELLAGKLVNEEDRAKLPNLNYLYRMGVQESLVHCIEECINGEVESLAMPIERLEAVLAACLGKPRRYRVHLPIRWVLAAVVVLLTAVAAVAHFWM